MCELPLPYYQHTIFGWRNLLTLQDENAGSSCCSLFRRRVWNFLPPAAGKLWWDLQLGGRRLTLQLWIPQAQQPHLSTGTTWLTPEGWRASTEVLPSRPELHAGFFSFLEMFCIKVWGKILFYMREAKASDQWMSNDAESQPRAVSFATNERKTPGWYSSMNSSSRRMNSRCFSSCWHRSYSPHSCTVTCLQRWKLGWVSQPAATNWFSHSPVRTSARCWRHHHFAYQKLSDFHTGAGHTLRDETRFPLSLHHHTQNPKPSPPKICTTTMTPPSAPNGCVPSTRASARALEHTCSLSTRTQPRDLRFHWDFPFQKEKNHADIPKKETTSLITLRVVQLADAECANSSKLSCKS